MTGDEAKAAAIKETPYCFVLAQAWWQAPEDPDARICLERIYVKEFQREEIRLAWWQGNRQMMRPADVNADGWAQLFADAVANGVFEPQELTDMRMALEVTQAR